MQDLPDMLDSKPPPPQWIGLLAKCAAVEILIGAAAIYRTYSVYDDEEFTLGLGLVIAGVLMLIVANVVGRRYQSSKVK